MVKKMTPAQKRKVVDAAEVETHNGVEVHERLADGSGREWQPGEHPGT